MAYNDISLEMQDGVAILTINRPKVLNAIDPATMREFSQALCQVAQEEAAKVMVLTGAGDRAFCSGADINWLKKEFIHKSPDEKRKEIMEIHDAVLALTNLEKPVIAAVNGAAVGGGCNIALACDIRIASDRATISEIFAHIAAIPDCGGSYFLPRLVGTAKALELIFTADIIDAQEALRLGLFNKVVPHDQLMSATMDFAKRLAKGPAKTLGFAKKALYKGLNSDLATALEYEATVQGMVMETQDFKEGITAFLEKRKAVFKGK